MGVEADPGARGDRSSRYLLTKATLVTTTLMTGFPGFLGSALLPRLLARREGVTALCLVQPRHLETARDRVRDIEAAHAHTVGRIELVTGDITAPDLGTPPEARRALARVSEVWHLAAVYDLAVGEAAARAVNVGGTARVLEFCRTRRRFTRLHHVSTCYVSGRYEGEFGEDDLDEGQTFRNHYEVTKFEAEMAVRKAMADGLPATVYRPGIVVGDSRTGETQKYDGPYFLAAFLRRQLPLAVVPAVGEIDRVKVCLVPRDFVVDAMDALAASETTTGQTFALTDPDPPTVRELVDTFSSVLRKRVVWVPLPLRLTAGIVGSVPGLEQMLGIPAESLEYFASPTTYSTTNTTAALVGTGVECPAFRSYAPRLLGFMASHPKISSAAMV
jgi:thioester reductase-like protein